MLSKHPDRYTKGEIKRYKEEHEEVLESIVPEYLRSLNPEDTYKRCEHHLARAREEIAEAKRLLALVLSVSERKREITQRVLELSYAVKRFQQLERKGGASKREVEAILKMSKILKQRI